MSNTDLYCKFLEQANPIILEFTKHYPKHETQFHFNKINKKSIEVMYYELRKTKQIIPRPDLFNRIKGLQKTCSSCYSFYMTPRNHSAKFLDIKLGKKLEDVFINFLNGEGISARRTENKPLNYPDIEILNSEKQVVAYCEFKYLSAPFLIIYKKIPGRDCYEGSNTLDVGEKIQRQRVLVETNINVPVYYVYWLDYPCVKGIFYMTAKQVYDYIDSVEGVQYDRKERSGDFIKTKDGSSKKLAETKKVYLPLFSMEILDNLMNELKLLYGHSSK